MTKNNITQIQPVLASNDIPKHRHEVLIKAPGLSKYELNLNLEICLSLIATYPNRI